MLICPANDSADTPSLLLAIIPMLGLQAYTVITFTSTKNHFSLCTA